MTSETLSAVPCVALVAADDAGIAALRPTREALDGFAVVWRETLLTDGGSGSLDARGLRAIIVASADAALPAALSEQTRLPVIRVPIPNGERGGIRLLQDESTANLLAGGNGPFATVAIGEAGAKNAALFVVSMLGLTDARLRTEWLAFRQRQTDAVLAHEPLAEL